MKIVIFYIAYSIFSDMRDYTRIQFWVGYVLLSIVGIAADVLTKHKTQ